MNDFSPIIKYVSRHIQLNPEEEDYFTSLLRITKVRKRQFIVQPEFVCRYRSYVFEGALMAYLLGNSGEQYTIAFAVEDWWITDYNSYINQVPATLFVQAMEDTTLIQIEYNSEQLLLRSIPKFERFFRIITERSLNFTQQRVLSNLSKSAEERYLEFVNKYPGIVSRVPQYALASYLGFSTEFLSKIRNRLSSKKTSKG
ncbi:MAG: Crp/Fnr family transcriptional regulator [Sphingobacteriales bacterium]